MLKLITWPTSPFGAKVKLALCTLHLFERITIEHYHPWERGEDFRTLNPLKKIPVLVRENGTALYDSPVICEYVNTLRDETIPTLFPQDYYYDVLTVQALCDGMLDCGVSARYETHFRPKHLQSSDWISRQMNAIESGGRLLKTKINEPDGVLSLGNDTLNLAHLCVLTALSYLDVRYANLMAKESWGELQAWKKKILTRYPDFESHLPRDYLPLPDHLEGIAQ